VPLFDEADTPNSNNRGRLALDNRFLAKPDTETGVAREVLLVEVARNYSFDDARPLQTSGDRQIRSLAGPLEALLRFNPTERVSLKVEVDYDTLFKGISDTSLTGNYGFGQGNYVAATWFTHTRVETGKAQSDQARLSGAFNIRPWNLHVEGQLNYDFQQQLFQDRSIALLYTGQCYGLRVDLRQFQSGNGPANVQDKEIRFSLNLKNVGTFLDLNSRTSANQP
jgi:lipopolysaccharide assembly outer membrane protein LptD (OstA)